LELAVVVGIQPAGVWFELGDGDEWLFAEFGYATGGEVDRRCSRLELTRTQLFQCQTVQDIRKIEQAQQSSFKIQFPLINPLIQAKSCEKQTYPSIVTSDLSDAPHHSLRISTRRSPHPELPSLPKRKPIPKNPQAIYL
jgi:hypothetical protein